MSSPCANPGKEDEGTRWDGHRRGGSQPRRRPSCQCWWSSWRPCRQIEDGSRTRGEGGGICHRHAGHRRAGSRSSSAGRNISGGEEAAASATVAPATGEQEAGACSTGRGELVRGPPRRPHLPPPRRPPEIRRQELIRLRPSSARRFDSAAEEAWEGRASPHRRRRSRGAPRRTLRSKGARSREEIRARWRGGDAARRCCPHAHAFSAATPATPPEELEAGEEAAACPGGGGCRGCARAREVERLRCRNWCGKLLEVLLVLSVNFFSHLLSKSSFGICRWASGMLLDIVLDALHANWSSLPLLEALSRIKLICSSVCSLSSTMMPTTHCSCIGYISNKIPTGKCKNNFLVG
jgi:hypothetical protein